MPAARVSMRRVREVLRLKHDCGASIREIARSTGVARSTVAETLERVAAAGLGWPLPARLGDQALEAMLFLRPGVPSGVRRRVEPHWVAAHRSCAGRASL